MSDDEPKPKRRTSPLNLTLAGIPELQLFENPEDRESALVAIQEDTAQLRTSAFWLGVLITAASGPLALYLARVLLRLVEWTPWFEELLTYIAAVFCFAVVLRALHRHGAAAQLRVKLLAQGVPVCTGCGYLLRGLPLDPGRCPECAQPFDDRVREILTPTQSELPPAV